MRSAISAILLASINKGSRVSDFSSSDLPDISGFLNKIWNIVDLLEVLFLMKKDFSLVKNRFLLIVLILLLSAASFANTTDTLKLVDVAKANSQIVLDIRYATKNNFTGQILYDEARFYLRESTAKKFLNAVSDFKAKGFGVKVFDGYRPLSVQKKMWKVLPDEKFVADPAKGSRHNRGGAIDLTLLDKNGKEIEMGTQYDDFTEKAHPQYKDLPQAVLENRKILHDVMEMNGFSQFPTEWWHFDDKDWESFGILDLDFSQIK